MNCSLCSNFWTENNNDIEMDKIGQLTNSSCLSFHAVKNLRNELHHPNSFGLGYHANQIQIITSCLCDLGEIEAAAYLILDYSQFLPNLKRFPLQKSITNQHDTGIVEDGHWVSTSTTRYGRVIKTKRPKDTGN